MLFWRRFSCLKLGTKAPMFFTASSSPCYKIMGQTSNAVVHQQQQQQSKKYTNTATKDEKRPPYSSLFEEVFEEVKEVEREQKKLFKEEIKAKPLFRKLDVQRLNLREAVVHRRRIRAPIKKVVPFGRLLKGLLVNDAIRQLAVNPKKVAEILHQSVRQLRNNAINIGLNADELIISRMMCGRGQIVRKLNIHAKGKHGIRDRRLTHVSIWARESVPFDFLGRGKQRRRKLHKLKKEEERKAIYKRFEQEKEKEEQLKATTS